MKIKVNNIEKKVTEKISVKSFLDEMKVAAEKTLVTVNGETLSLDEFDKQILKENDNLELFTFVGGG